MPSNPLQTYLWYNAASSYWTPLMAGTNYFDFVPTCFLVFGMAMGFRGFRTIKSFSIALLAISSMIVTAYYLFPNWPWLSHPSSHKIDLGDFYIGFGLQGLLYIIAGYAGFWVTSAARAIYSRKDLHKGFVTSFIVIGIVLVFTIALQNWESFDEPAFIDRLSRLGWMRSIAEDVIIWASVSYFLASFITLLTLWRPKAE